MALFISAYKIVPQKIDISCSRYHELGIGKTQRYCPFVYPFALLRLQFWIVLTEFNEKISIIFSGTGPRSDRTALYVLSIEETKTDEFYKD